MTILRLPHNNTRWVWEIEKSLARSLIEIVEVRWNGEEWWVKTRTLPTSPDPSDPSNYDGKEYSNTLDRFWEAVTPVGGRLEDLSNPISEEQYQPTRGA